MRHLKARLLGVILIVLFAGLTYLGWYQLTNEGRYSMKLAAFGPVGVVGGLFVLLFPNKGGKPETTRDKIIVLVVFGVGLMAGLLNWYLMDPGFFGR
jgi:NhaP-type Na+/H+ or K+/H+ antiporter